MRIPPLTLPRRAAPEPAASSRLGLGGDLAVRPTDGHGGDGDARGAERGPAARHSTGHRLGTRAVGIGLAVAVASGPVALGWEVLKPAPAPAAERAAGFDQRAVSRRSVAAEVAVASVEAWLGTARADAKQLAGRFPGLVELPEQAVLVSGTRMVDAVASAPGVWSVTVTASTRTAAGRPARQRYYQVLVAVEGDPGSVKAAPMALPAAVPGPQRPEDVGSGAYSVTVAAESPLGSAVRAFLAAMLTGAGEVSRYTTPGSDLRVVAAPYASAAVTGVQADQAVTGSVDSQAPADGAQARVQASVALGEKGARRGSLLSASVPLTLTARGGRWEVTSIDTALKTAGTPVPGPTVAPATPTQSQE